MLYQDCVVLVYAKAPVAGKVNTRLIPDIGVQAATQLQYGLIHDRLSMLSEARLCDVRLMCAPDSKGSCFVQCGMQYPITLFEQRGDDLGERMFNGINEALDDYRYSIVIGTDAPSLDIKKIKQSIDSLRSGSDVVIVPAEDGGYVLIAMRQAHRVLFDGIPWGCGDVMQQTRAILQDNGITYDLLTACWDIDRLEDYRRYLDLHQDHSEL